MIDVIMVEFDYVGMFEVRLYFEFANKLIHAQVTDLHFGDDFERKNASGRLVPALIKRYCTR